MTLFFLSVVMLHINKKNSSAALMYGFQSALVVLLLGVSFYETGIVSSLIIALLALVVKVVLAPVFILRFIRRHEFTFSVSTYVNFPLTLIIVSVLTAFAHSSLFTPLVSIDQSNVPLLSLALSSIFVSFFLIINRKGALSQIIGILSLENSIVAFALFAGLEQTPGLQVGILFDISIWVIISTIFIGMIYRHFGSLDVTVMKHLQD